MRGKVSLMYVTTLGTEMKGMHYNIALRFEWRQGVLNIWNRYKTWKSARGKGIVYVDKSDKFEYWQREGTWYIRWTEEDMEIAV